MRRTILILLPLAVACSQGNNAKRPPNGTDYTGCYFTSFEPSGEIVDFIQLQDGVLHYDCCWKNCDGITTEFSYAINENTGQINIYKSGKLWDKWRYVDEGLWKDKDSLMYINFLD